ncbi:tudor domain-containing protein 5 [Amblyraja radiata]|uniref:tudor domain-containing protein 5 n=1 Tax=Amblyraja radiata TaxID=386614 RepID=UPI0014025EF2|nr:tudor domain-containing protein 5 [Amblyraja radiata]
MSEQEQLLEVLKKELRSLLISAKNSLSPAELEKDYQTMMGKRLPLCALGYRSTMELVSNIPDTIKVHSCGDGSILLKGVGDETTKGIEELVAKAKVSTKTKRNLRKTRYERKQTALPRRCNTIPILPALVKCELRDLVASFPCGVLLSDFDMAFLKKYGRPFQYTRYGFYSLQEVLKAISEDIEIQQTRQGSLLLLRNRSKGSPLTQGKSSNQSIQANQTQSKAITMQPNPNKSPTNKPLNWGSMSESTSDTEYFDKGLKKLVEDLRTVLVDKGVGGTMDSEVKKNIKFTVAQRPGGLLASQLPLEYKNIFGMDLPLKELGFYNVTELVGALNDIFYVERDSINHDWRVFDNRHSSSLQNQEESQFNKTNELPCADWKKPIIEESMEPEKDIDIKTIRLEKLKETCSSEFEIPPDAVQDGILYKLPELEENSFTCVFVESVTSPSQFYVRSYGEWTVTLEDLMIEIRRCYSFEEVSGRYVMPDSFIQPGQVCCVRNPDDVWWYRVIIHQVLDEKQVEVYYVDFGDISLVERSGLRFLKCCYSKLPAQGIPSTLMWLQPVEDDWSTAAKSQFLRFCGKQPLVALICGYVDDVLHLFLCDTSTDEDIYINDVLTKAGHAVPCHTNNITKGFGRFNPTARYLKKLPLEMESTTTLLESKPERSIAEGHKHFDISASGNNKQDFELQAYDLPHQEPYPDCFVPTVGNFPKTLTTPALESAEEVECNEPSMPDETKKKKQWEKEKQQDQSSDAKLKSQDDFYISLIDSKQSAEQPCVEVQNVHAHRDIADESFKSGEVQPCIKTDTEEGFGYICEKESMQTATGLLFNDVQRKSALISPVLSGQREFHLAVSSSSAALGPSARMAGALHRLTWLPVKNKNF